MESPPLPRLPVPGPEEIESFLGLPTEGVVGAVRRVAGSFLVLGAGGKIGLHVCIMLRRTLDRLGRTDSVTAVSRFSTLRDRSQFGSYGIHTLACDLSDPAAVARLPDAPNVFFLAGVKFGTTDDPRLLQVTNVTMPRLIAARFCRSRIVAFSSGCVYPFVPIASGGATEELEPDPIGEYAASCLARERAFADSSLNHGNPTVLLRLNYSVEFRYGLLVDIAEAVLAGHPIDVTTGYMNVIWQRDAVAHSIQALEIAGSPAPALNITGPETLAVRDMALRFGSVLGRSVKFLGEESDTAWLNNAHRSHALFGAPATSVDTMIQWICAWLQSGGTTWGKPTSFERRDGRY